MSESARTRTGARLIEAATRGSQEGRCRRSLRAAGLGAVVLVLLSLTAWSGRSDAIPSRSSESSRPNARRWGPVLGRHASILRSYTDDRGKQVVVRPEEVLRYLGSQGVDVSTQQGLRLALTAFKGERFRTLPPVLVVQREGSTGALALEVEVGLPPGETPEGKRFTLTPEGPDGKAPIPLETKAFEPVTRGRSRAKAQGKGPDGQQRALWKVRFQAPDLPWGYHTLALEQGDQTARMSLVVAPTRMPEPPGKTWGVNLNVGSMNSYTEAAELVHWLGQQGAGIGSRRVVGRKRINVVLRQEAREEHEHEEENEGRDRGRGSHDVRGGAARARQ